MLHPHELHVGDLAKESDDGITLLLPRDQYESTALIGRLSDQRYGVLLDGDLPGEAYLVKEGTEAWRGILIPGVKIEIDERSAFDPSARLEVGALVRGSTLLSLVGSLGRHVRIGHPTSIILMNDLPACEEREAVGFRKWSIVIGEGQDKRELISVNAEKIAEARKAALNR